MRLPIAVAMVLLAVRTAAAQPTPDWSVVDRTLGRTGTAGPANVMRYAFPRSDLQVTVGDVKVRPALALGSYAAFLSIGPNNAMVMGDLVLTQEEVGPVMKRLQTGGISFSALHHHLIGENPRVLYMHISGHGAPAMLAATIRAALTISTTPLDPPAAGATPPAIDIDTAAIARTIGVAGRANGGVYGITVPRRETIIEEGHEIPPSMGVGSVLNFQPTGGGKAAITGDFVMLASEVAAVQQVLIARGIIPTSLHSHLVGEQPTFYFMHFWAVDDAVTLARGLRAALDQTNSALPR